MDKEITLKTKAALFQDWQKAKSDANSAAKKAKKLEQAMNLPDAKSFASDHALTEGDKLKILLVDGNSQPIGKISVFHQKARQMPAYWSKRIS